jgi:hypothetical protein
MKIKIVFGLIAVTDNEGEAPKDGVLMSSVLDTEKLMQMVLDFKDHPVGGDFPVLPLETASLEEKEAAIKRFDEWVKSRKPAAEILETAGDFITRWAKVQIAKHQENRK